MKIKEFLYKNYIASLGWKANKKYLIIESDDWGAIRMPNRNCYNKFLKSSVLVDKYPFDKYDSLESEEDLVRLFEVLSSVKDSQGNSAVLTSYQLVANPNFEKIQNSNKEEYSFETIDKTYLKFSHSQNSLKLIKEGIDNNIFIPQFHGREHIHVKRWMEAIKSKSIKESIAFNEGAIISSIMVNDNYSYPKNYFAGQDFSDDSELSQLDQIHTSGLKLFEEIFGFKSQTFTAQGGFWGDQLLNVLNENGIKLIGGRQFQPIGDGKHKFINKLSFGEKNKYGQILWRRNSRFEPSENQEFDWVSQCLKEINIAFKWNKPAIISSHRMNFIGTIFENNRAQSLLKLKVLLNSVVKIWPDVIFISTHELANILSKEVKSK
jgi:hypothetical protein